MSATLDECLPVRCVLCKQWFRPDREHPTDRTCPPCFDQHVWDHFVVAPIAGIPKDHVSRESSVQLVLGGIATMFARLNTDRQSKIVKYLRGWADVLEGLTEGWEPEGQFPEISTEGAFEEAVPE